MKCLAVKLNRLVCFIADFCKQLVASGNYSDVDVSEPSMSSEEENNSEKPFSSARHPFSVRDSKPILMNIRVSLLTSTLDIKARYYDGSIHGLSVWKWLHVKLSFVATILKRVSSETDYLGRNGYLFS